MSDWDEFTGQLLDALRRFVQGDAEPYKSLWSRAGDVTIFGGWGAYEQGWAAVEPRLEWDGGGSFTGTPTSCSHVRSRADFGSREHARCG